MNVYTSLNFSFGRKGRLGTFDFEVHRCPSVEGNPQQWAVTWANRTASIMDTATLCAKVEKEARGFMRTSFIEALAKLPPVDKNGNDATEQDDGESVYADTSWCADDILTHRPQWGMTKEEAANMLDEEEDAIQQAAIEAGWRVLDEAHDFNTR